MNAAKPEGSGCSALAAIANTWPINLRTNRTEVIIFPDGVPKGGSITIDTEQQPRGKRIQVTTPGRASVKHRKKARAS